MTECGSTVRWMALLVAVVLLGCVDPQPKSLTLPSLEDAQRQELRALTKFNARRFKEECASIDSILQSSSFEVVPLPAGIRLARSKAESQSEALNGWLCKSGDRVVWSWVARSLKGDSLSTGVDEFIVDRDAVPQAFHEVAKHTGHNHDVDVWSPSVSAFGVRGVPGEIPPYTPVHLEVNQRRSIRDTAWARAVMRGEFPEAPWLNAFVLDMEVAKRPAISEQGLFVHVHSTRSRSLQAGEVVLLRIRTSSLMTESENETDLEWSVGTPDQLVPALERALVAHADARTLSIWAASNWAFGADGIPSANIPPRSPIRFDVEVVPL